MVFSPIMYNRLLGDGPSHLLESGNSIFSKQEIKNE